MAVKPKQISVILVIIEKKYGGEKQTDFGGSVAIKKKYVHLYNLFCLFQNSTTLQLRKNK